MEDNGRRESAGRIEREEIFSKAVRAGKRTYFFDVKATRKDDYYLTVTESKKRFHDDGTFHYEKHKIFLYKEDFEKFIEGLNDVIGYIDKTNDGREVVLSGDSEFVESDNFTDVSFEDLDRE